MSVQPTSEKVEESQGRNRDLSCLIFIIPFLSDKTITVIAKLIVPTFCGLKWVLTPIL